MDIEWYPWFKKQRATGRMPWNMRGLRLLEKGLGIDDDEGDEIIQTLYELLPGHLIIATTPEGKRQIKEIARQLKVRPDVGHHFDRRPSWDQATNDFVAEAAYCFVMVANGINRDALAQQAATGQAGQVQAPVQAAPQGPPRAPHQAPRQAPHQATEQAPHQATEQAPQRDTPQVPQPLQQQQAALEDVDMQEAPALAVDEEEAVPGSRKAPIKLEDDDEPAGVAPNLRQFRAPGMDVLYQHMIQVESMDGENFGIASTTVTDLFNTVYLPHPIHITIAALRTFWVNHRRRAHEPANDPTRIDFGYVMSHGLQRINDDATLRFAYRGWLSLNNPWTIWNLVVVNDYDDEYYDPYSDEDEEVDVDRQRVQYLRARR